MTSTNYLYKVIDTYYDEYQGSWDSLDKALKYIDKCFEEQVEEENHDEVEPGEYSDFIKNHWRIHKVEMLDPFNLPTKPIGEYL